MCEADDGTHHRDHDAEVTVDDPEEREEDPLEPVKFRFCWRKLWRFTGPGWLMSLAYLDPGNLESDLQQGAYTGYSLVWVLFWATVMGLILQEMCLRLGLVTGKDLAQTVRQEYPLWLNYIVYFMMEIAVIGADIQEVVGSAIALNLLTDGYVPVVVGCIITALDTFTFLAVQYMGVRYLEAFISLLILTMAVCFFVNWGKSRTDPAALLLGWAVPTVPAWGLMQAVSAIGAVIMPHNLYLHSGLVLSRKVNRNSKHRVHEAICYARIESAVALLCAFFINLAVVATNSNKFYVRKCAELPHGPFACLTADAVLMAGGEPAGGGAGHSCVMPATGGHGVCAELGLTGEGYALGSALGSASLYVWALGLFAAGQASTMVCTYAGQIIMGGCIQIELRPWKRTALTRLFALGPALLVAVSTYDNSALFNNINEYLNVLQSVQLPFAMLPALHFARSPKLLGIFASTSYAMGVSYALAAIVMGTNFVLVIQFVHFMPTAAAVAVAFYSVLYTGVCARLVVSDRIVDSLRRVPTRTAGILSHFSDDHALPYNRQGDKPIFEGPISPIFEGPISPTYEGPISPHPEQAESVRPPASQELHRMQPATSGNAV